VFSVTSVFSVFAYIWLLVMLKFISPNVIDLWEAVVTFVAFPVLVILSYVADKYGSFGFKWKGDKSQKIEMGGFQPGKVHLYNTKAAIRIHRLDRRYINTELR
jgi:solute carrier family 8 (sodium/calcium exchanger)